VRGANLDRLGYAFATVECWPLEGAIQFVRRQMSASLLLPTMKATRQWSEMGQLRTCDPAAQTDAKGQQQTSVPTVVDLPLYFEFAGKDHRDASTEWKRRSA
jgi:hypothetical protein